MNIVNIGVLGCANIADRSVIPAIKSLPEKFNLVAVASRSAMKAMDFSDRFDCEAISSYEEIIGRQDIQALYIPLPTGLHQEWINKALKAGKHVYAEKSIAFDVLSAFEMVDNAKKFGKALMEGFMFQYHSQHDHLKMLLSKGVIGEIRHFSSAFGFPPLAKNNFRYDNEIGGGAVYDACAYPVRAAFFILGDSLKVTGSSIHFDEKNKTSIYGSAFMKGYNGVGVSIAFGFDNSYQCYYQIWGSSGRITVEKAFTPKPDQIPTFILETQGKTEIISSESDDHFIKAMSEFYSIIIDDKRRQKHFTEILQQCSALEQILNSAL